MPSNCGAGEDSSKSLRQQEIKQVNLKGNQPWICIGRTDAEAEGQVFWSSDANSWCCSHFGLWCWERLRAQGEEGIRGWDGWMASPLQWTGAWANFRRWWETGRLECCNPWDCKELDMTGQLNNNNNGYIYIYICVCVCITQPQKIMKDTVAATWMNLKEYHTKMKSDRERQILYGGLRGKGASLVAQRLKCLPGMQETWAQSLGREDPLEKEIATHSSTLAWRIPWREEPGRLQSMGSQRVGHDWVTSLHFTSEVKNLPSDACHCRRHRFDPWVRKIPWRRKWQPTPVFMPGKSHGQRSLVGYSPWGYMVGHNLATKQQYMDFKK